MQRYTKRRVLFSISEVIETDGRSFFEKIFPFQSYQKGCEMMPRNLKSIETKTRHMTKAERESKQIAENKLKNTLPKIKAPTWLDTSLKRRFNWYVNQAKELNTLTVLDSSMLARYVIYEARFIELEKVIQGSPPIIDGKINPLLVEQRQTHDKLEKIESKLGFNPSDRLRFAVPQEEEIDELEAFKDELRNIH